MKEKTDKENYPNGSIIIVDGSDTEKESLEAHFKDEGYEAIVCKNPQRVFRVLDIRPKKWAPILIAVDMVIPGHSGFEVVRQLSRKFPNKRVPLLMLSKEPTSEDLLEATNAGAQDLGKRPFDVAQLRSFLEKVKEREERVEQDEMAFKMDYS